jgi:taurine dioxygenase
MPKATLSILPMSVGAEVAALPPGAESDPEIQRALREAWLKHGFLLFRKVETSEQHLALTRCFGELEIHPVPEIRCKDNPYLVEIGGGNRSPAYVYDGGDLRIGRLAFHRDTAFTPDICKGAMLRMVEVPASEGETMIADTAAAYDDLPADMQTKLSRLEYKATLSNASLQELTRPGSFWRTARKATADEDPRGGIKSGFETRYPSVVQPAMLVHPESGRKCIFLSPTYVDQFLGMEQSESDELLAYLTAHMLQPKYVYKHKWTINDAILWDNRRVMHGAMGNKLDEPRRALRTTLAGPMRTGRFFDKNIKTDGLPVYAD